MYLGMSAANLEGRAVVSKRILSPPSCRSDLAADVPAYRTLNGGTKTGIVVVAAVWQKVSKGSTTGLHDPSPTSRCDPGVRLTGAPVA